MRKIRNSIVVFFILVSVASNAQNPEVVKTYINTYKDLAIAEMQRTGVPASITLAQGIHESTAGTSWLVQASNNHFGIKCKSNWTGESVKHDDDARGECFRKYPVAEDSYKDHSDFLKNGQRYAFLFQLDPTDYEGWANGLKKAGYATNPKYPLVLIKLVEDYNLQDYSLIALGKPPAPVVGNADAAITTSQPVTEKNIEAAIVAEKEKPVNYPEGRFLINETKVIYAKKGTSFLAIAKQYDVDLSKLFEFNEMKQMEEVDKDRLIFIQRKRKTGNNELHIVQSGESLHDIAQLQAIRLESLIEYNWLRNDAMPAPGEQLSLKKKSSTIPKLAIKTNYSIVPGIKK
jgi:Mannosyl-glycoprotein endo-beta-N-acetylglucosaminidase/LysM domain